jgi:hypothetical protein
MSSLKSRIKSVDVDTIIMKKETKKEEQSIIKNI